MNNDQFQSPSRGKLNLEELTRELTSYIGDAPKIQHRIIIGTDSEGNGRVEFVTAIVIHRVGHGGRYFWQKSYKNNITALRHKIYEETNLSLLWAQELLKKLRESRGEDYLGDDLEIHIDVGEGGATRDLIKEVVGMVKGNGFNAKTKPESFGASSVADKHVK
ncbi:ribonuclease H-like YkuK family protein [Patescibacteria group bacterium]|nr:ribonuclease H-like YkuK family protein [Patescibacteria group bacterium]MBU4512310.1 ribonuclease H-like YkuK family protein [Patescibacteria group bacterium]MCG2692761.1 ribonuclease H-like YkuK family protein [Candidatus Parcubacteria bacterium]